MMFEIVKQTSFKSNAVVILPLSSLMHDKVRYPKSIGLTAEFIGEDRNDEETRKAVQKDDCQIVFGSPEPCLSSDR